MLSNQNFKEILSLLRCVECGSLDIRMIQSDKTRWLDFGFLAGDSDLICGGCNSRFPVTDDGIPILWTSQIKELLRKDKKGFHEQQESSEVALSSNIRSYDRISDDYAVHWRRDAALIKKIKEGAARLLPMSGADINPNRRYHLDIGCGPGHVLEWLNDFGFQQIGLDVSLTNLRNARKSTDAYVVLGDATSMPFRSDVFSLVTESSVLHHIFAWEKMILESCRVCCKDTGGILFDTEPTMESLNLSRLARLVFDLRWPVYKALSYIDPKKLHFRNISFAREYYMTAEVHNQPGKGFLLSSVREAFEKSGFLPDVFLSPNEQLIHRETIPWKEAGWKRIVLQVLSGHNPLLAVYGSFTVIAKPSKISI